MYPGWIVLGTDDPWAVPPLNAHEIVNNGRAYAYAENAGICWLDTCDECEDTLVVVPGGPNYLSPILDPAPWYDVDDPDSWGFLGVIGMEVIGAESSTRQASVQMALTGGGVIGPTYLGPRTLVVRALAIATDECSLSFGLNWLRDQYQAMVDPCSGDPLTFFDCCPCVCDDDQPGGPCWVTSYAELRDGPTECEPEWWPTTYAELMTGAPPDDEEWCSWPDRYRELRTGPPAWSCCIDACVVPYMRQYANTRVVEGPTILQHPKMSTGALAEIEFTIVAADPIARALLTRSAVGFATGAEEVVEVPEVSGAEDPFAMPGRSRTAVISRPSPRASLRTAHSTRWARDVLPLAPDPRGRMLSGFIPTVRVRAREASGLVRIGLWRGPERVAGWRIPFMPADSMLSISGRTAEVSYDDIERRTLPSFVRDWDGGWPRDLTLPHGEYHLTIDQEPDSVVRLLVDASVTPVGAG